MTHDHCCDHDHGHHDHLDHSEPHGHSHGHSHGCNGHDHSAELRAASRKRLWWAFGITFSFLLAEVVGGIFSGSLALLADAGHMLTDVAALGLAIFVSKLASLPPTSRRTYGLLRAEVLGAFLNGVMLVLIVGFVLWEAIGRINNPHPVDGPLMLAVAFAGLIANLAGAWILHGGKSDSVNMEAAYLHMAADALGSIGAIVAGVVIWTTGWTLIDPLAGLAIGGIILWGSVGLLRRTTRILLNAVPDDLDYTRVKAEMEKNPHVAEVRDLHIWTVTSGVPVLTAHVRLVKECATSNHWHQCLASMQEMLNARFGILHSTLQFEPHGYHRDERWCDLVGS